LGVPFSKSSLLLGGPELLSFTMLLGTVRVTLPNGISFCPAISARCTNVTDTHTDRWTDHTTVTSVTIGGIMSAMPLNEVSRSCYSFYEVPVNRIKLFFISAIEIFDTV